MKKKPKPGRRRFYYHRSGSIHISGGLAAVIAHFYFLLRSGTDEQREAAEEWKNMFLNLRSKPSP